VYMIYIKGHITKLQYNEYIYKQLIYLMDQNKNRWVNHLEILFVTV